MRYVFTCLLFLSFGTANAQVLEDIILTLDSTLYPCQITSIEMGKINMKVMVRNQLVTTWVFQSDVQTYYWKNAEKGDANLVQLIETDLIEVYHSESADSSLEYSGIGEYKREGLASGGAMSNETAGSVSCAYSNCRGCCYTRYRSYYYNC